MKHFFIMIAEAFRAARSLQRKGFLLKAQRDGLRVGQGTKFVGSHEFGTEPFLITIGSDCLITDGVRFITHDGAIQVPLIAKGEAFERIYGHKSTFKRITIENNVFIGVSTIIMPGTTLRNNTIVAAGSVVGGTFPENIVIAGNPAKIICTLDQYYEKNRNRVVQPPRSRDERMKFIQTLHDDTIG